MREVLTSFPVYNKDGSFNGVNLVTGGVMRNPAADLQLRTSFNNLTNILATFYAEYKIVKGLTFKATLGPKISWYKNNTFLSKDLPGRKAANQGGRASIGSGHGVDILQENTLTYMKFFKGGHKLNAVAGFTWQRQRNESFGASTDGLAVDGLSYDALGTGDPLTFRVGSGAGNARQIVSWLGRANYSFNDKYLLTLAGRVDGASVYSGSNNAYAFFPSDDRRYDLIRWGILVEVVRNTTYPVHFANKNIRPHHVLLPIPQQELILNPALLKSDPTNNGYR